MGSKIKNGLYLLFLGLLILPLVQEHLHLKEVAPLDGAYNLAPPTQFSVHTWFEGSYQQEKNKYCNDWLGFRPYMVRLNNQLDFTLFRKTHADGIILGTDNYLYQFYYTDDYSGKNKLDTTLAHERLWHLKALQDTLEKLGKTVLLVHAPSKASLYPEHFPQGMPFVPSNANHTLYRHIADSLGIHQLDINDWFVAIKNSTKEMLMSRQGVHWTVFGSVLAADSLIKYFERVRHISMPALKWNKAEHSTDARLTDNDISKTLNLIFPVRKEVFCYPEVYYAGDSTKTKPNAIYIGDSFVWTLISDSLMKNVNRNWEFWYYFHEMHNQHIMDDHIPATPMDGYDWLSALQNTDCLVFVYTSHNLPQLGNGFLEKAYNHYFPAKK